jgi:hypothetical protein
MAMLPPCFEKSERYTRSLRIGQSNAPASREPLVAGSNLLVRSRTLREAKHSWLHVHGERLAAKVSSSPQILMGAAHFWAPAINSAGSIRLVHLLVVPIFARRRVVLIHDAKSWILSGVWKISTATWAEPPVPDPWLPQYPKLCENRGMDECFPH